MKKLFSLLLVLLLCLSLSSASALSWIDGYTLFYEAGIPGDFRIINDVGMKIWLPYDFYKGNLSYEEETQGYVAIYTDNEISVSVMPTDLPFAESEYVSFLQKQSNVTFVREDTIGDLPCVIYGFDTPYGVHQVIVSVKHNTGSDTFVQFTFAMIEPVLEEACLAIASSIQPAY